MEKLKKIANKELLIDLISYSKGYRKQVFVVTLLKTINSLASIAIALTMKNIIDAAIDKNLDIVSRFGILVVIALIGKLILSKFTGVYTINFSETMYNNLQYKAIQNYYKNTWLFMNQYNTGDLLTRSSNDVSKIVGIYASTLPNIITLLTQLIVAFLVLSRYDPLIALIAFIISPATFLISYLLGNKLKQYQADILTAKSELSSFKNESIKNMDLIQAFNAEDQTFIKLKYFQDTKKGLIIKKSIVSAVAKGIIDLGFTFGFLAAVLIGAYKLYNGEISFGTFTAFSQLVSFIQSPIQGLAKTLPSTITVLSAVERLSEFNQFTQTKMQEKSNKETKINHLIFENVSFTYDDNQYILVAIDLSINFEETVALIGKSGQGKTTFLRLIMAMIQPTHGSVQLATNIGNLRISQNTRDLFSYVPQKNRLFSGSIYENLLVANPNATVKEVDTALEVACCKEFIDQLPHKLETSVNDRQHGLSEGQIQRICIARALVHNTPYIILDEATSALDEETEKIILNNISQLLNKSIIIVTHKSSVLEYCDSVYKISSKKITKVS